MSLSVCFTLRKGDQAASASVGIPEEIREMLQETEADYGPGEILDHVQLGGKLGWILSALGKEEHPDIDIGCELARFLTDVYNLGRENALKKK